MAQMPPSAPQETRTVKEGPKPKEFDEKHLKGVDTSTRRELSDEEIQQQFFKKSSAAAPPTVVYMPVFYERMETALAKIKTVVTQTPSELTVEADANALFVILDQVVDKAWLKKLNDLRSECKGKTECMVPLSRFADPEVKINFDESALELRIHVPPELRSEKISSLFKSGSSYSYDPTDHPSWFSSFINANFSQVFRSDAPELENGREPVTASLDSGTRLGGLLIEARGRWTEPRKEIDSKNPPFVREDVRAVYDWERKLLRAQAGDLSYPVTGFQMFRPMGGAAVFSQFSLRPSLLTHPSGSYELFLARPSKVAVYLNDRLIQILHLPAGKHNLRDFPFASGLNDLKLEITDDTGRTETRDYSYFSNNTLLKPGLNEISYAVGAPSKDTGGEREYDSKNTIISAYHRIGVTQKFTAGLNFQQNREHTVYGLESVLATGIGFFALEPAYSVAAGYGSGYAGRLRYVFQNYVGKERRRRFFALEFTGYSEDFLEFGNTSDRDYPIAARILATHSRNVNATTNLNIQYTYQFNRPVNPADDLIRSFALTVGLNRRWNKGFSTSFNLRHQRTPAGAESLGLMAYLIYSMPEERQYVTANTDTISGRSRAEWGYQPHQGAGALAAQANFEDDDGEKSYGGAFDYSGNRVRLNATHQVSMPEEQTDPNQAVETSTKSINYTRLNLGTALVFAGGHFAISRPVQDSFAVLVPLESLKGQNVRINPQTTGAHVAHTDWLGSAVYPEIPSYSISGIQVDTKSLKPGTAVPRDSFLVKPKYKSGYAIPIGSDATVYLDTQLLKDDGTPAGLIGARAIDLNDTSREPVMVFTNREGLLRSEGFRPSRYRLEVVDGGSFDPVEFEIPKSAGTEYKMPPLKLKPRSP